MINRLSRETTCISGISKYIKVCHTEKYKSRENWEIKPILLVLFDERDIFLCEKISVFSSS